MHTRTLTAAMIAALSITMAGASFAQSSPSTEGQQATASGKPERAHGPRGPGAFGSPVDALARLDTDNDGRISRTEAQAAQDATQARRDAHRAARAERGDAAAGERTGRAERATGPRAGRGHAGPRRHHGRGVDLVTNFDAIDQNRDGQLSRAELRTWHTAKATERRAAGEQRFETMFRAADLNGDGRLSRVEVSEKMPRMAGRFAWMDENGDGVLSREELQAGRMQR